MRAKGLLVGALIASLAGVASASAPKVPEAVSVEVQRPDRDRAETIRAILEVCQYLKMQRTYTATSQRWARADCLDLFQKLLPKSDE